MTSSLKWLGSVCNRPKNKQYLTRREFIIQPMLFGILMGKYITPHFTTDEMRCKGTGICTMDEVFMELLETIRCEYGKPMIVTSGYRAPEYNAKISKSGSKGTAYLRKGSGYSPCWRRCQCSNQTCTRYGDDRRWNQAKRAAQRAVHPPRQSPKRRSPKTLDLVILKAYFTTDSISPI